MAPYHKDIFYNKSSCQIRIMGRAQVADGFSWRKDNPKKRGRRSAGSARPTKHPKPRMGGGRGAEETQGSLSILSCKSVDGI